MRGGSTVAANQVLDSRIWCRHHARRSLSTVGGTHVCPPTVERDRRPVEWPINPPLLSSSHSPSFSPPRRNGVRSHSRCGTVMNCSWTCVSPYCDLLDYRVPTTPCTSRLKTKRLKTLSTYQENIASIKSSRYYSTNIGGDVSPLSHRDRRPCLRLAKVFRAEILNDGSQILWQNLSNMAENWL